MAPQVIEAIAAAVPQGLRVPIVYNTSSYDALASLRLLDGLVDVYFPDFKFWSTGSAKRLAKGKDYPERAKEAILEMVMPGQLDESEAIFRWLATEVSPDTYVNVMGQYRPT